MRGSSLGVAGRADESQHLSPLDRVADTKPPGEPRQVHVEVLHPVPVLHLDSQARRVRVVDDLGHAALGHGHHGRPGGGHQVQPHVEMGLRTGPEVVPVVRPGSRAGDGEGPGHLQEGLSPRHPGPALDVRQDRLQSAGVLGPGHPWGLRNHVGSRRRGQAVDLGRVVVLTVLHLLRMSMLPPLRPRSLPATSPAAAALGGVGPRAR
jgi:hypothetical protein